MSGSREQVDRRFGEQGMDRRNLDTPITVGDAVCKAPVLERPDGTPAE